MNNLIDLVNKKLEEYIPVVYPDAIFRSMKYTLSLPGKRLRPIMCLETVRMLGGNIEKALPTACAIEMLHVQSLIHDDLPCMDNDDFRRGKPSNHKVFGEANAVLAGDALLTFAPQIIIEQSRGKLSDETILRLVHEYTKFAGAYALIAGQVVDIESENGKLQKTTEETLDFIHLNKTASLFRLPIRCGAIIAGQSNNLEELDRFAQNFGLAFQIYDDIMDEISTFEELGKTIGKDRSCGKLTYVSLYGLEEAKKKFGLLINNCYDIVNKYDSQIFNEILDKLRIRILGV